MAQAKGGAAPAAEKALARAARARKYYDEAADERARTHYYRDLPRTGTRAARFARLSELLKRTHRPQPAYQPSQHVYPWVDLQPSGKIHSLYSGRSVTAEELIRADAEIDRLRAQLTTQLAAEVRGLLGTLAARETPGVGQSGWDDQSSVRDADVSDVFLLVGAAVEAALPYNCEHVVPQSWFGRREPMRGDLHHLFACDSRCNSFRGNTPYFDFPDFGGLVDANVIRNDCGKKDGNQFEPVAGKGAAARATLYFLLRYPGHINRVPGEYDEARLKTILAWHDSEPVTQYERHRNMAIVEKQGTRNPLIDFPEWAAKIDFERGLGA